MDRLAFEERREGARIEREWRLTESTALCEESGTDSRFLVGLEVILTETKYDRRFANSGFTCRRGRCVEKGRSETRSHQA